MTGFIVWPPLVSRLRLPKEQGHADWVRLFTRRGCDWTQRYPRIASAVAALRRGSAVVDGEAVFCDGTGVAAFEKVHSRAYDDQVFLCAFDLLELDSEDWRPRPLAVRKARLSKLIAKASAAAANAASTARP